MFGAPVQRRGVESAAPHWEERGAALLTSLWIREEEDPLAMYQMRPCGLRCKRCGDAWEEVGAAANFRCPREEERNI